MIENSLRGYSVNFITIGNRKCAEKDRRATMVPMEITG